MTRPLFYIGKRCNAKQEMGKNPLLLLQVLGGSFGFLQSQVLNLDIQTPPCVRVDLRVNNDGSQKSNTQFWYISVAIKKSDTLFQKITVVFNFFKS